MKKEIILSVLICALLCFAKSVNAQSPILSEILKIKPVYTSGYKSEIADSKSLVLKMNFGSPEILNPEDAKLLVGKAILQVDLVYTAFQISDTFSQPKLNKERFLNLQKLVPDLFRQSAIKYKIIGQNGCKTEYSAHNYFHGFVITYKDPAPVGMAKVEIAKMDKLLHSDSLGHDTVNVVVEYRVIKHRDKTGFYLPILKSKRKKGIVYDSPGIWHRKLQRTTRLDTVKYTYEKKKFKPAAYSMKFVMNSTGGDSTIFAVLNRNKNWKEILFVCDVTGSMYTYSSELLVWHKLNYQTGKAKYFTFFNDGDNKSDGSKKIGATGGIYQTEAGNYEAVSKTMTEAMTKGCGGDAPENNCEALLEAMKKFPDSKEIVMIADNWAPIKDIKLLEQIKKPVHVIVCGGSWGINTDYLDLARKTGGSIHTIESDIKDLIKVNEGEKIKIGSSYYKIVNGKFVPVFES